MRSSSGSPPSCTVSQLVEEMGELLHDEGVALGQPFQHHRIAVVMREVVVRLGDADLRNGQAVAFAAVHVGDHARHVGAQGQHDQVEHGAPVFAGLWPWRHRAETGRPVACRPPASARRARNRAAPCAAPRRGPSAGIRRASSRSSVPSASRSDFASSNTASSTLRRLVRRARWAATPPGSSPNSRSNTWRGLSSAGSGTPSREKASVVEFSGRPVPELMDSSSEGKRVCWPGDLGHELVAGNGVLVFPRALGVDLGAGQPGIGTDMRLAEAVGMMQAAENGEVVAMLLQRLERRRKVVIAARPW